MKASAGGEGVTRYGPAVVSARSSTTLAKCELVISSEDLDPDQITAGLGVTPTRARRAGELIRTGGPTVPRHLWVWQPKTDVALELDAQLDAIWARTKGRGKAFRELGPKTDVEVSIVIEHHGAEVVLGWSLEPRHVTRAADLGAGLDIDEYDYTDRE